MRIKYVDGTVEVVNLNLVERIWISSDESHIIFTLASSRRVECHKSAVAENDWAIFMNELDTWV